MFLDSSPALGTVKYACKVDVSWSVADDSWGKYEAAMKAATRKNVIPGCASVTERWTIPWDLAVSMILWYFIMPLLLFVVEGIFSKNVWYVSTSHISQGKHARTKVVLRHGKLIHARAFGFADLETKRPFSLDTLCRTFCLTKTYVPLAWSKWLEMDQTWCSLETIKMWLITELATLPEYYCVFKHCGKVIWKGWITTEDCWQKSCETQVWRVYKVIPSFREKCGVDAPNIRWDEHDSDHRRQLRWQWPSWF